MTSRIDSPRFLPPRQNNFQAIFFSGCDVVVVCLIMLECLQMYFEDGASAVDAG